MIRILLILAAFASCGLSLSAQAQQFARAQQSSPAQHSVWNTGDFHWKVSQPLLSVSAVHLLATEHPWIAVKDPSVVRYDGKWRLFCTLRKQKTGQGRIRISYCHFTDCDEAADAHW